MMITVPSYTQDTIHPPFPFDNFRHTLRNGEGWDFFGVYMLNIQYLRRRMYTHALKCYGRCNRRRLCSSRRTKIEHSDPGTVDFHFWSGFWKHLNLGMTHEILLLQKDGLIQQVVTPNASPWDCRIGDGQYSNGGKWVSGPSQGEVQISQQKNSASLIIECVHQDCCTRLIEYMFYLCHRDLTDL